MGFHQCGEAELTAERQIIRKLFFIQNRGDQQHRRRAQRFRLVDHVGIHGKILAQAGPFYGRGDFPQLFFRAEKTGRFGENGDRVGPRRLIRLCNRQIRILLGDDAFGGGRLFAFADERELRTGQRFAKGGVPFWHRFRRLSQAFERQVSFCLLHAQARSGGKLIEDRHDAASGRLLTSISRSSTRMAAPLSMSSAARLTPSLKPGAFPAI